MKMKTLNVYETEVTVVELEAKEIIDGELNAEKGIKMGDSIVVVEGNGIKFILDNSEYIYENKRERNNLYGEGLIFNEDRTVKSAVRVVGENLDEKQMANLLVRFGAEQGICMRVVSVEKTEVVAKEEEKPVRKRTRKPQENKAE